MADIWGEVGTSAGKIFTAFAGSNKALTMAELKKKSGLDETMLSMALGWLAREEKVVLDKKGAVISVKLK
jgi:DNA-binding transcriptional regulator GbsR (MarR family)